MEPLTCAGGASLAACSAKRALSGDGEVGEETGTEGFGSGGKAKGEGQGARPEASAGDSPLLLPR